MAGRKPGGMPAFSPAPMATWRSTIICAQSWRSAPQDLSPTRFHNSVHNAPAGYWAIASGCMASTNAVSAGPATFGAGLLEAGLLAATESVPVVFAAYDIAASGPLADVVPVRKPLAVAFVLAPRGEHPGVRVRLGNAPGPAAALAPAPGVLHPLHGDNPVAYGLPLLAALARGAAQTLVLPAGPRLNLELEIATWQN